MVWENGTATPLQDVFIEVRYRRHRVRTNERGEYWRLLSEGVYQVFVTLNNSASLLRYSVTRYRMFSFLSFFAHRFDR